MITAPSKRLPSNPLLWGRLLTLARPGGVGSCSLVATFFGLGAGVRTYAVALAIVWIAAVATWANADLLSPIPAAGYRLEGWVTEDGLPENSATAIVQTPDGYLWFGTFRGLVRFDGTQFAVFNPGNTPEMPSPSVVNLHLDKGGRLWASTYEGLIIREGTRWRQLRDPGGFALAMVRTFSERADGDLLITTFNGAVYEFSAGNLSKLPAPPGERDLGYLGASDEDGQWWVVQEKCVARWEKSRWVPMIFPSNASEIALGCTAARDGGIWLLTKQELLKLRRGTTVARLSIPEDPGSVWSLFEDSEGNVWIASYNQGFSRITPGGVMTRWRAADGASDSGRCVFEDRERNLWLGTSGDGLLRLTRQRFQHFELQSKRRGLLVHSVSAAASGGVWAATFGQGLYRADEAGGIRHLPATLTNLPAYLQSVLADRNDRLWVSGLGNGGLWLKEHTELRRVPADDNLIALFEDSRERIWMSSGGGRVSSWDGEGLQVFDSAAGLPRDAADCFAEDSSGSIWVASASGVFRQAAGQVFEEVRDAGGTAIRGIACMLGDRDGSMWLGSTDRGLLRWKKEAIAVLDASGGFPVSEVGSLLEDNQGFFWMTSGRRIVRAGLKDLHAVADARLPRLTCQVFDTSDGLPRAEFTRGRQPASTRDKQGRLWFATGKGVAMVNPAALRLNSQVPPVSIEQISFYRSSTATETTTGGRRIPEVRLQVQGPFAGPVLLPPGSRRIEIGYVALSLTAPEKVRYQVQIQGVDADWQDVEHRRTAFYYELPPRAYTFRVRAANNDGLWNESGASLAFVVQPHLWETGWFRLGVGLLLVALGAALVWTWSRKRIARALEREQLAHEVVEARQRMNLAAEAAQLGLWAWDILCDRLWTTDRCRELLALPAAGDISSETFFASLLPEDRALVRHAVDRAIAGHLPYEAQFRVSLPDEKVRWIAAGGHVDFDTQGKPVRMLGTAMDITERKLSEFEREQRRNELAHLSRVNMLGELAGSLAHELNQPLTSILSNAQAAQRLLGRDQADLDDIVEILADIVAQDKRAGEIIHRLRLLLKKGEAQNKALDLNDVVQEVLKLVRTDLVNHGVTAQIELAPGLPVVMGDSVQLQQVLLNLVINACDAMASTAPDERQLRIQTELSEDGLACVSVADSGAGIAPDKVERVFEPFYSTKSHGLGLGLTVCRTIITAHRGKLWAENNPERGASFRFALPVPKEQVRASLEDSGGNE
ncbi:MAG: two-component regulator propeller domain-containing protein [Verrucomicrobiia bacterium]